MLKNYLTIALRNLRRHRAFSFINIAGLAVGMACALLILLYVQDELSYDQYHANKDRMYRLVTGSSDDIDDAIAKVSGAWGVALLEDLAEVEKVVRFRFMGQTLVSRGETRFYEGGAFYVDPSVFEVFSFPLIEGDPQTALTQPNSIVLTRSIADRYFGEEDPLGQTLTFDSQQAWTVTGVMEDVPATSHFTFPFLATNLSEPDSLRYDWVRNQHYTYLLLDENASPETVEAKIPAVLTKHLGEEAAAGFAPFLQPITRIHLHSHLFREMAPNGNVAYVYIFSLVAFFIVLIACINFMNLTTARSVRRAKEVGVRKASGARRGVLIQQFLGESLLLSGLAMVVALGFVSLFLPAFNHLTGKALSFGFLQNGPLLFGLLGITLFVGVVAGSYPAFVLSSFRPAAVLKGERQGAGRAALRKGLVVFQFAISAFLIIAAGIVQSQLTFIQSKDLGFSREQIVTIPIREDAMREQYETFKETLLQNPGVVSVAVSGNLPGGGDWGIPLQPEGLTPEETPDMRILVVDQDFLETYEMEVVAGRDFSGIQATSTHSAFLLNEEAARQLGWTDPVGKQIGSAPIGLEPSPVVGVVKDFHFRSLHETIAPLVFFIPQPDWFSVFSVRVRPDNIDATLAAMEATWARFEPNHPFSYTFLDEQFGALYESERQVATLLNYATGLAVLIACLGLFGLTVFTAEQRIKEIGIRKVLGASVPSLVVLLSKDFLKLVALALIIAAPIAYLAMNRWLDDFAYRVEINVGMFLLAGGLALLIALLTVSYQAIKAALADPVKSLRYE